MENSSKSSSISLADEQKPQQQTPILWAYERGQDQIVALLKHYANKRPDSDVCSEYRFVSGEYRAISTEASMILKFKLWR